MSKIKLQNYLYEKIPQVKAMGIEVESIEHNSLTVTAPLEPNINHRNSVFGGSASAVATVAAWALLHNKLVSEEISTTLVIQKNTMTYDCPINGKFSATAEFVDDDDWNKFIKMLKRKGKARINVVSTLNYAEQEAGKFHGSFVAVGYDRSTD